MRRCPAEAGLLRIERRGRDLNPRRTFQHVRDFQSRSLDHSDTSPSDAQGTASGVAPRYHRPAGGVAERSNAAVSKTVIRASGSEVQILSPPLFFNENPRSGAGFPLGAAIPQARLN